MGLDFFTTLISGHMDTTHRKDKEWPRLDGSILLGTTVHVCAVQVYHTQRVGNLIFAWGPREFLKAPFIHVHLCLEVQKVTGI